MLKVSLTRFPISFSHFERLSWRNLNTFNGKSVAQRLTTNITVFVENFNGLPFSAIFMVHVRVPHNSAFSLFVPKISQPFLLLVENKQLKQASTGF